MGSLQNRCYFTVIVVVLRSVKDNTLLISLLLENHPKSFHTQPGTVLPPEPMPKPEITTFWETTIRWFNQTAPDRVAYQTALDATSDLDALPRPEWTWNNPQFYRLMQALPGLGTLDKILTHATEWMQTDMPPDGVEALCLVLATIARHSHGERPQGRAVTRFLERVDEVRTGSPHADRIQGAATSLMAAILSDPRQRILGFPNSDVFLPESERQTLLANAQQGQFDQVCSGLLPYYMGDNTYLADCDIQTAYRTMQNCGEQLSNENLPFPQDLLRVQTVFSLFARRTPPRFTWSERREIQEFLLRH